MLRDNIKYRSLSIPDILDVCSTLVVYDESLDRFRFAHLSVRESLESQPGYTTFEANRSVVERSLQTVTCHQPSGDPFWSYAILYWIFHYHRLGEQLRKEVFELHGKRFLFNGATSAGSSDAFNTWVTEAYRLNHGLLESESLPSQSELIYSPSELARSTLQDIRMRIDYLYSQKKCSKPCLPSFPQKSEYRGLPGYL